MKIVGPTLLAAYEGRIINIHPAYLPEFPGAHGIEDAWNAGVDQSGVTIHWVDSGVDTGKVIKQVRVPRLEGDTLDTFETASTKQSTSSIQKCWIFGSCTKIRKP